MSEKLGNARYSFPVVRKEWLHNDNDGPMAYDEIIEVMDKFFTGCLSPTDVDLDGIEWVLEDQAGQTLYHGKLGSLYEPPPLAVKRTPLEI